MTSLDVRSPPEMFQRSSWNVEGDLGFQKLAVQFEGGYFDVDGDPFSAAESAARTAAPDSTPGICARRRRTYFIWGID